MKGEDGTNAPCSGSITKAVHAARAVGGFALKIEVECQSEAEADEAIEAGADIVMLDNFSGDGLKAAAASLRKRWQGKKQVLLECSGGLTESNVAEYINNGMASLRHLFPLDTILILSRHRHHFDKCGSPRRPPCRLLPQG